MSHNQISIQKKNPMMKKVLMKKNHPHLMCARCVEAEA